MKHDGYWQCKSTTLFCYGSFGRIALNPLNNLLGSQCLGSGYESHEYFTANTATQDAVVISLEWYGLRSTRSVSLLDHRSCLKLYIRLRHWGFWRAPQSTVFKTPTKTPKTVDFLFGVWWSTGHGLFCEGLGFFPTNLPCLFRVKPLIHSLITAVGFLWNSSHPLPEAWYRAGLLSVSHSLLMPPQVQSKSVRSRMPGFLSGRKQ